MDTKGIYRTLKDFFRRLSLRTQLLLILIFLLAITVSSLMVIYSRTEKMLLQKVTDDIDEIMRAIQISMEEMVVKSESTERLKGYLDVLNKKGINEISIMNDTSEVIASSNLLKIGTKGRISRKKDFIITAKLGEESKDEPQRLYNAVLPVTQKGQNVGYIHISMVLDDYKQIQRKNHIKRILSTVFAFTIGIILCLVLSEKYARPIKQVAEASKKIADGDLVKIEEQNRSDEVGTLISSYNEMVDKLVERKALEEKLKKSEQLSIIGQLSSGIAHEVRNPLNFLLLSIGHVREKISASRITEREDLVKLLNDSAAEIRRVNGLIHDFLLLGRPITLKKESINLKLLIEEAVYVLKDKIPANVTVSVSCPEDTYQIYCDREYMRICIMNLILNGAQANSVSGTVTVSCDTAGNEAAIIVSDSGSGIKPEELDKIFEPYYSTKTYGFGLGLSITKRFVEEHNGTISIDSELGKGTTITIRIPTHEG